MRFLKTQIALCVSLALLFTGMPIQAFQAQAQSDETTQPTQVQPLWSCWYWKGMKAGAFEGRSYEETVNYFQEVAYSKRGFSSIRIEDVTTVCRKSTSNDTVVVASVSHGNGTSPLQIEVTYLKNKETYFTSIGTPMCQNPEDAFHLNSIGRVTCERPNGTAQEGGSIDFVNDPTLSTRNFTLSGPSQPVYPTTTITVPEGGFDALSTPHFSYTLPSDPTMIRIDRTWGDQLVIRLERNNLPAPLRDVKIERWDVSSPYGLTTGCDGYLNKDTLTCSITKDKSQVGKIAGSAVIIYNGKEYRTQRFVAIVQVPPTTPPQQKAYLTASHSSEMHTDGTTVIVKRVSGGEFKVYGNGSDNVSFVFDVSKEFCSQAGNQSLCKEFPAIGLKGNECAQTTNLLKCSLEPKAGVSKGMVVFSAFDKNNNNARTNSVVALIQNEEPPSKPTIDVKKLEQNFKFSAVNQNGRIRLDWSNLLRPEDGYYAISYARYSEVTGAYEGGAVDIYTNDGTYSFITQPNKKYVITLEVKKKNGELLFARSTTLSTISIQERYPEDTPVSTAPPAGYEEVINQGTLGIPKDEPVFSDTNLNTLAGEAAQFLGLTGISGGRPPECRTCKSKFDGSATLNKAEFSKFALLWLMGPHAFDTITPQMRNPQTAARDVVERHYDNLVGPHAFYNAMLGVNNSLAAPPDINTNAWYWIFISEAMRQGMIQGHPDGRIGPGEQINTATALTIIRRMVGDAWQVGEGGTKWSDVSTYDWFYEGSLMAYHFNLLPHRMQSGNFRPNATLTRYETAVLFLNLTKALRQNANQ